MKIIFVLLLFVLNCMTPNSSSKGNLPELTKIEITGIAYDRKGGAIVDSKSIHYWIEGKESWENKYLNKKVIVKGLLDIREDNPVFIDNSEIKAQGIPVSSEKELEKNKKRFWILKPEISLP